MAFLKIFVEKQEAEMSKEFELHQQTQDSGNLQRLISLTSLSKAKINLSAKRPGSQLTQTNLRNFEPHSHQASEIYRLCELDIYEDELEQEIIKFNENVEKGLNQSFCCHYTELKRQMSEFNSIGFAYIKSNLTERMEGLVIYACDGKFNVTIFYLTSLFKVKYREICSFVIKKLRELLCPMKIQIKALHIEKQISGAGSRIQIEGEGSHFGRSQGGRVVSKPSSIVKDTFIAMGYKITSITFDCKRLAKYSIFEKNIPKEEYQSCRIDVMKGKLTFKCQILLSNQAFLAKQISKPLKRSRVDFRALTFFAFLSYLKNGYSVHKQRLESLNAFDSILKKFEKNMASASNMEKDTSLDFGIWKSQTELKAYLISNFGMSFLSLIKMRDYGDKAMRIASAISKFSTKLKYCDYASIDGVEYSRIRQNNQTYCFVSKLLRRQVYVLSCDKEDILICIFPHKELIQKYYQDKQSYSFFGNSIFQVKFSFFLLSVQYD